MAGRDERPRRPLFAESCRGGGSSPIRLPGTFPGRRSAEFGARARFHFTHLSLTFHDLTVFFPNPETAEVVLTGGSQGAVFPRGYPFKRSGEIDCVLKKQEGRWLFNKWEIVEVLKR